MKTQTPRYSLLYCFINILLTYYGSPLGLNSAIWFDGDQLKCSISYTQFLLVLGHGDRLSTTPPHHVSLRQVVNETNALIIRRGRLWITKKGKFGRTKPQGRGKYKAFTPRAMLESVFLDMLFVICLVHFQFHC